MTTLGWVLVIAAVVSGVYGFAWALCNAARIGDGGLGYLDDTHFQQFDVEQPYVDAEFARITAELDAPFDQEQS